MRAAYRVLAISIAVGVVLQAMFIALAWFTALKDMDGGAVIDKNTDENFGRTMHSVFGSGVIPALAILLLIVSFFAHVERGVRWALYVFGVVVLQFLLAAVAYGAPVVGLLHGLNAFALAAVASLAARRAAGTPAAASADSTEATT